MKNMFSSFIILLQLHFCIKHERLNLSEKRTSLFPSNQSSSPLYPPPLVIPIIPKKVKPSVSPAAIRHVPSMASMKRKKIKVRETKSLIGNFMNHNTKVSVVSLST